jgi:hypothetical protein
LVGIHTVASGQGKKEKLQNYKITKLQNYKFTKLQNYKITKLQNYKITKLRVIDGMEATATA